MEKDFQLKIDSLDQESALEATKTVAKVADENGVDWALCGGIAMQVYNSPRLTKDIDFIASQTLPLPVSRRLSFVGDSFLIQTTKQTVDVDWIKRIDDW